MFEWKVEAMKLLQERPINYSGKDFPFNCELELSQEEKIQFIDSIENGRMTYILELVNKFGKERNSLAKNKWGGINTNSLKAWIKRNDCRHMIDCDYDYGKIRFLGVKSFITRLTSESDKMYYETCEDFINDVFHVILLRCRNNEIDCYKSNDEYEILKEKFRNRKYRTTFGVHIASWSSGRICVYDENDDNKERDITIDELKLLIEKDEELDRIIQKMSSEINITY